MITLLGHGRLGAMIHGGIQKECWQLNEASVWYGENRDRNSPNALVYLAQLRRLLDEERVGQTEALGQRAFVAIPEGQRHYETLGDVQLHFSHTEETCFELPARS
jgi:alpha-L-fucosidase 2